MSHVLNGIYLRLEYVFIALQTIKQPIHRNSSSSQGPDGPCQGSATYDF